MTASTLLVRVPRTPPPPLSSWYAEKGISCRSHVFLPAANTAKKTTGSDLAGQAKGTAEELRGQAAGKAQELKGQAKGAANEAAGKAKGAANKM